MKWDGSYIFPPRPQKAVTRSMLPALEDRGMIAQYKKNGSCTVVKIIGGKVEYWNRHGEKKSQCPTAEAREALSAFYDCVLIGELMSDGLLYLFDIVVYEGNILVGSEFSSRMTLLLNIFEYCGQDTSQYFVNDKLSVAKSFTTGFTELFDSIECQKVDEGIVLKDQTSTFKYPATKTNNGSGQLKCRKPTKSYDY